MIRINKKLEYALVAIKYMAEKNENELTSAREVCDLFKTPFDTTAKVLQIMNNNGVLKSVKGIKGGYQLNISLAEVSYMQLSNLIDGKAKDEIGIYCETARGTCELYSTCNIVGPIQLLNNKINRFLRDLSLEELLFNEDIDLPLPMAIKNKMNFEKEKTK